VDVGELNNYELEITNCEMCKKLNVFTKIKTIIIKLRSWLERNKIFFEVFSYLVIGLAGIYFSISQLKVNQRQIEIQRSEIQPIFKISFTLHEDTLSNVYNTEVFEIYNEGKPLKSFNYNIQTFYKIDYISQKKGINKSFFIPISGFYWAQFPSHNSTGLLTSGFLKNNNSELKRIYDECLNQSKDNEFYNVSKFSLITIDYKDLNDTDHRLYFKNREPISYETYNELINKPKELKDDFPIDVEKVTLNIIKEKYMIL